MEPKNENNSLTCSHSTAHSSSAHIRRCIHGMSWVYAHTWRHAHMGSGYIHQHSLFQSTLGRQSHKITATIVIYDLHVSKRSSILSLHTNKTSSIISGYPKILSEKRSSSFSAKTKVGCSFQQPDNMLEAPLCLWSPVLYARQVSQIALYSLPAHMRGNCAGCWQHILASCTKTDKTFKVSWLGCRAWDWNPTAKKAGKENNKTKQRKKKTEKKKRERRSAKKEPFGPESVFLFGWNTA